MSSVRVYLFMEDQDVMTEIFTLIFVHHSKNRIYFFGMIILVHLASAWINWREQNERVTRSILLSQATAYDTVLTAVLQYVQIIMRFKPTYNIETSSLNLLFT